MGLIFRKSITILPGVKVNLSKSGASLSVGTTGLHASINTKGRVTGSVGLPGSGISYRKSAKVTDILGLGKSDKKADKAEKASKKAKTEKTDKKKEVKKNDSKKTEKKVDEKKIKKENKNLEDIFMKTIVTHYG